MTTKQSPVTDTKELVSQKCDFKRKKPKCLQIVNRPSGYNTHYFMESMGNNASPMDYRIVGEYHLNYLDEEFIEALNKNASIFDVFSTYQRHNDSPEIRTAYMINPPRNTLDLMVKHNMYFKVNVNNKLDYTVEFDYYDDEPELDKYGEL